MSKIDTLTAGELATAEVKAGQAITALEDPNAPKIALLTALAWVVMKRDNPKTKFEDAQNRTLNELMETLGLGDDDADPLKES